MLNLIGNAVRTKASRDGTQQGTGLSRWPLATVLKSKRNLVATLYTRPAGRNAVL
jgi:hypothetical protein